MCSHSFLWSHCLIFVTCDSRAKAPRLLNVGRRIVEKTLKNAMSGAHKDSTGFSAVNLLYCRRNFSQSSALIFAFAVCEMWGHRTHSPGAHSHTGHWWALSVSEGRLQDSALSTQGTSHSQARKLCCSTLLAHPHPLKVWSSSLAEFWWYLLLCGT